MAMERSKGPSHHLGYEATHSAYSRNGISRDSLADGNGQEWRKSAVQAIIADYIRKTYHTDIPDRAISKAGPGRCYRYEFHGPAKSLRFCSFQDWPPSDIDVWLTSGLLKVLPADDGESGLFKKLGLHGSGKEEKNNGGDRPIASKGDNDKCAAKDSEKALRSRPTTDTSYRSCSPETKTRDAQRIDRIPTRPKHTLPPADCYRPGSERLSKKALKRARKRESEHRRASLSSDKDHFDVSSDTQGSNRRIPVAPSPGSRKSKRPFSGNHDSSPQKRQKRSTSPASGSYPPLSATASSSDAPEFPKASNHSGTCHCSGSSPIIRSSTATTDSRRPAYQSPMSPDPVSTLSIASADLCPAWQALAIVAGTLPKPSAILGHPFDNLVAKYQRHKGQERKYDHDLSVAGVNRSMFGPMSDFKAHIAWMRAISSQLKAGRVCSDDQ